MRRVIAFAPFIITIFMSSCGIHSNHGDSDPAQLMGLALEQVDSYSSEEKTIISRICYAVKSKRANFPTKYVDHKFNFQLKGKNCSAENWGNVKARDLQQTLKVPALSEAMFYDSDFTGKFDKYIQTDASGHLEDICQKNLSQLELPSPTTDIGTERKVIRFFTINDVHQFYVYYGQQVTEKAEGDVSEKTYFKNYRKDIFQVVTDSAKPFYGMISFHSQEGTCQEGSKASSWSYSQLNRGPI